jgi:hypothetical protein
MGLCVTHLTHLSTKYTHTLTMAHQARQRRPQGSCRRRFGAPAYAAVGTCSRPLPLGCRLLLPNTRHTTTHHSPARVCPGLACTSPARHSTQPSASSTGAVCQQHRPVVSRPPVSHMALTHTSVCPADCTPGTQHQQPAELHALGTKTRCRLRKRTTQQTTHNHHHTPSRPTPHHTCRCC